MEKKNNNVMTEKEKLEWLKESLAALEKDRERQRMKQQADKRETQRLLAIADSHKRLK